MKKIELSGIVQEELLGKRLDQALAILFPDYSRAQWQRWITSGYVAINGQIVTEVRQKVKTEDKLTIQAQHTEQTEWQGQALALEIVYEDESLIVINKPAGLVVHPGAGNPENTLVNALLHRYPELSLLPRAGLVHRLDKDTTGLLVVARTLSAYHDLVKQLQHREVHREYFCIVQGNVISGATIDAPLGRHPVHRTKRAVVLKGKTAITHYRVYEHLQQYTALQVKLETGRTHQIRVHLAHVGFPIVGDPVYGTKKKIPGWHRQALHAQRLSLQHPETKKIMTWEAPLPDDLQELLMKLRNKKDTK